MSVQDKKAQKCETLLWIDHRSPDLRSWQEYGSRLCPYPTHAHTHMLPKYIHFGVLW